MNYALQHTRGRTTDTAPRASRALTLIAMSLGFVVVQLDVTVVNVALERIGASFGSHSVAGLQWVVNAYTVVFASLILTSGALGDRLGAKRLFNAGFGLFVMASIACGAAPSLPFLIIARAIQGIGASILVPCSLTLLNHTYEEPGLRARAVGIWAGVAGVALAGGPVIGGALIASISWRIIFFINLPLGLLGILLTTRYAAETTQTRDRPLDLTGQATAIAAIAALAATIIEGGAAGWLNPLVLAGFGVFALAGAAFIAIEAHKSSPMLPLVFFHRPAFAAASLIGLLINLAFYGVIFDLSLYFQQVRSFTPLMTGLVFLPMTAAVVAANILAGWLQDWRGARLPMTAGQIMFLFGCGLLAGVDASTPYTGIWWQTVLIGSGIGLTVPPMTSALLAAVDRKQSGIASGALNTTRQIGSAIGVALFGSLIASHGHFVEGIRIALFIAVALMLIGTIAGFVAIPAESARGTTRPK
jgi:MFS transporter, DHA2 family, methylenomycin A resistance protein